MLVAIGGGPIQGVVRNKINTGDLRSATVIDFLFGCVLFWKASIPPSCSAPPGAGLLAGREIAIRWRLHPIDRQPLKTVLGSDVFKAGVGIVISWRWPWPFSLKLWVEASCGATSAKAPAWKGLFGCR